VHGPYFVVLNPDMYILVTTSKNVIFREPNHLSKAVVIYVMLGASHIMCMCD
jgi:uncharacterized linocin/CFP29 family protein